MSYTMFFRFQNKFIRKRSPWALMGVLGILGSVYLFQQYDFFSKVAGVFAQPKAALTGPINVGGTDYYVVTSTDPTEDTGDEVCAKAGKTCVGYTNLTTDVCVANNPTAAVINNSGSGSSSGFYCDGASQGGFCATQTNTCAVCPTCIVGVSCSDPIGGLYREMYVECGADLPGSGVELNNGSVSLSTYDDLESQVTVLDAGQGAYAWTIDGSPLAFFNMPFHSGPTQSDFSSNGNTGTVSGAVFTTSGCVVGNCFTFDGFDDYVQVGDTPSVNISSGDITIEAWIYPERNNNFIVGNANHNSNFGYYALVMDASARLRFDYYSGGSHIYTSTSAMTLNTWHHVVAVHTFGQGAITRLYVDGVEQSGTWTGNPNLNSECLFDNCELWVGRWYGTPAGTSNVYHFDGMIDEVKIYNRRLTPGQVANNYADGLANLAGPTIVDSSMTTTGQEWYLTVTPIETDGTVQGSVDSDNQVTVAAPTVTVQLNNGNSPLSTYVDLESQVTGLGNPQGAYTWTVNSNPLMRLNMPFNAGATQTDYSDLGNNGAVTGAIFTNSGCAVGGCLAFNGTSNFVEISDSSSLDITSAITISAWIKHTTTASEKSIITKDRFGAGSDRAFGFQANGGNVAGRVRFFLSPNADGSGLVILDSTLTYPSNTWSHVVGTWDGATMRIYINGVQNPGTASFAGPINNSAQPVRLGTISSSGTNALFFDGQIDEVQLYPEALSQERISELYNNGLAGLAGPRVIPSADTHSGEVWDLSVTPFESDGTAFSVVNSANTVTVDVADLTVQLNNGNSPLSTYLDLESQVSGLGVPQGAYTWTVDAGNFMALNIPFNAGGTQTDYSGNSNNGVNVNGPSFHFASSGDCVVGGCLQFDGVNDYVGFGNPASLNFSNSDSFAISMWFNTPGNAGGLVDYLIGKRDISPYNYYVILDLSNRINAGIYDGSTSSNVISTSSFTDNLWHHVVFVRDVSSDEFRLYVDGVLNDATTDNTSLSITTTTQAALGCAYELGACINNTHFDGMLDEVQIYRNAISASQVAQLYADGLANVAGPTVIDSSSTIVGEVWNLDVTQFDSDGSAIATENSANTVTINAPDVTVQLNNGVNLLYTESDLLSQVTGLGSPQGAYTWTVNATNFMALNLPFNAGGVQIDYSGNGMNGTNTNGPSFQVQGSGICQVGGCMGFDGVNDYINFPDVPALDLTTNFSISLWHRNRDTNGLNYMLLSKHDVPTTKSGYTIVKYADHMYYFQAGDGVTWPSLSTSSDTAYTDFDWHHIVATYDGSDGRIYVDGVLAGLPDSSAAIATNNVPLRIGMDISSGTNFTDGFIDEVQIYHRVLSADEIAQLYADGSANLAGPTAIVAAETNPGEVWDLTVTQFDSDSSLITTENSANTVTISTNGAPTAPTNLFVSASNAQTGATNPIDVPTGFPRFSAIYNDPNAGDTANKYRIQVSTNNDFTDIVWDSGAAGTAMANCSQGVRCSDVVFGGTELVRDGSTYYWRIRYWDTADLVGVWSEDPLSTNTFTLDVFAGGPSIQRIQQQQLQDQQAQENVVDSDSPDDLPVLSTILKPTIGTVTVLGPHAIRYEWAYPPGSDIEGFLLLDGENTMLSQIPEASFRAVTEGGLPHNTMITDRRVAAYTKQGRSEASEAYPAHYTDMIGVSPRVVSRIGKQIELAVQEDLNNLEDGLSGVQFELFPVGAANMPVLTSEWSKTGIYVLTDTSEDVVYLARARARNQVGLVTEWSSTVDVPTQMIAPQNAVLRASLRIEASDNQELSGDLHPNTILYGELVVSNLGPSLARDVFASIALPQYVLYVPGTLSSNGRRQTEAVDGDFGQVANGFISSIWSSLAEGESHTIQFHLAFDTGRLLQDFRSGQLTGGTQATTHANPEITIQAQVSHQAENSEVFSNVYVLRPNLSVLHADEISDPVPPLPENPLPSEDEIEIIEQVLQEEFGLPLSTPQPEVEPMMPPASSMERGETRVSSDGETFNVDVIGEGASLGLTGLAEVSADSIRFTGTTTQPFVVVTLIFNDSITAIVVSDAEGYWHTFIDADRLGIQPGQEARVKVEAIAAKGGLRSERVQVGDVTVSRRRAGGIVAEFETTVSESAFVSAVEEVRQEIVQVIKKQEPVIQATLSVAAPVVVVSSVPLWGYLPYAPTLIYHGITYLVGLIGRKKRVGARFYGVAYDSITKQPLALAIIRVYKVEPVLPGAANVGAAAATNKKLVTTIVTDKQGRYDALLEPGTYQLEVSKPQYLFPSQIVSTQIDGDFQHVYNNSQGIVVQGDQITIPDVPLDPINAQRQWQLATGPKKLWYAMQNVGQYLAAPILIVGSITSAVVVAVTPDKPMNWIICAFYIVLLALQLRLRQHAEKAWGVVYDIATNAVLPLTTIQLIEPASSKVVTSRLSDYQGRFAFLPEPGTYVIKASKAGYQQVSEVIEAPQTDRAPLRGEVIIEKSDQRITGDIAMRQANT